jgi:hypothetical protein
MAAIASMPPGPCDYQGLGVRDPGKHSPHSAILVEQASQLLGICVALMAQGGGGMGEGREQGVVV